MITFFALGDYRHRQPLAYPQIRAQCRAAITLAPDITKADIVAVSHSKDLEKYAPQLRQLSPDQRLVLLSEEPFWDTVWGQAPLERQRVQQTPQGPLALTQLTHHSSEIYDFEQIPYFLLTASHFRSRYSVWFGQNRRHSPQFWAQHFQQRAGRTAFVMARRTSPRYAVDFPAVGLRSLCNQRTAIAESCQSPKTVYIGKDWQDQPVRQSLTDWHLDKFLTLNRGFGFVSALENTHQANYVTEKLFDAYAVGAVPLYIAGAQHRVRGLAAGKTWINLDQVAASDVPQLLADFAPNLDFCTRYAEQQQQLATLFQNPESFPRELTRLAQALEREFTKVLNGPVAQP